MKIPTFDDWLTAAQYAARPYGVPVAEVIACQPNAQPSGSEVTAAYDAAVASLVAEFGGPLTAKLIGSALEPVYSARCRHNRRQRGGEDIPAVTDKYRERCDMDFRKRLDRSLRDRQPTPPDPNNQES